MFSAVVLVSRSLPRVESRRRRSSVRTFDARRAYQAEAASRLHLPFPILSDEHLALAGALRLPTFETSGMILLKRLTLVINDGVIEHVFYPVFPPDRNASDVLAWLRSRGR